MEMVKEDNRRLLSAQVCNGAYFVCCTFVFFLFDLSLTIPLVLILKRMQVLNVQPIYRISTSLSKSNNDV